MTIEAMMSICTRRYPCANEYQLSCDSETGKIQKLNNMYVQDYGCSLNESVIEQLLEASFANGYVSTRWEIDGKELITNTPCSGWCRAPSSTEGIAMIETMMEHIAHKTQIDAVQVRLANMADRSLWKSLMRDIATDIGMIRKPERKPECIHFNELSKNCRLLWAQKKSNRIQRKESMA